MPGSPDDVVYKASVDDKTGEFFDRFDARLSNMAGRADRSFSNIEKNVGGIGKVAGIVGGIVSSVSTKALDMVLGTAQQAQAFLKECGNLAARAETLGVVLDVVGKNAGYSKKEIGEFQQGLQKTGISILESRESLSRMVQSELDLTQATKLARTAQDAAVIAGINSSEAFQRILWGITTLQPEILRTMGLTVDIQGSVQKWAAANGRTAESISQTERKQIALNAVLEAGTKITGAYEAAMSTVGKKMTSLVRYQQDFMVLLGQVFLEGMGANVDFMTAKLKEMEAWLKDNESTVKQWGHTFGLIVQTIYEAFDKLIELLTVELPTALVDVGTQIAAALGDISPEEMERRRSKLGTYLAQGTSILVATIAASVAFSIGMIENVINSAGIAWDILLNKISREEGRKQMAAIWETGGEAAKKAKSAFKDTVVLMADLTGLMYDTTDATEDAANATDDLAKAQEKLNQRTKELETSLDGLYRKMMEEEADRALKETRAAIEAELKASWAREDIARKHAEAVSEIMKNANKSQKEAAQNYAQAKIDIEKNYQEQLRAIQQSFEFDADEYARSRDAIGLLRAMRQRDRDLKQAKQGRDDQLTEAKSTWDEQKQQIDKQRQEALQALEEQERKELEEKQRQADRERQLQELKDQWAEEDRQKAYAKQLADLINQFSDLKGETGTGLDALLEEWRSYFGDLMTMAQDQMAQVDVITTPASTTPTTSGYGTKSGGGLGSAGGGLGSAGGSASGHSGGGIIGQGGQVSQALAGASVLMPTNFIPQIPIVRPTRTAQRQELDVKVGGEALDPYMQRVLVAALVEVERNRGGA